MTKIYTKEATKNSLDLINTFKKVAWYKINVSTKWIARYKDEQPFLYTNNEYPEKETRKIQLQQSKNENKTQK